MARSKSPKTNGVKEAVPARHAQQTDSQAGMNAHPAQAAPAVTEKAEAPAKAEADVSKPERMPKVSKASAPKLEAVRSEARGNVVPINLDDEIRRLAYMLSERRGFAPGHENED